MLSEILSTIPEYPKLKSRNRTEETIPTIPVAIFNPLLRFENAK